jgi:hypothetical protein
MVELVTNVDRERLFSSCNTFASKRDVIDHFCYVRRQPLFESNNQQIECGIYLNGESTT